MSASWYFSGGTHGVKTCRGSGARLMGSRSGRCARSRARTSSKSSDGGLGAACGGPSVREGAAVCMRSDAEIAPETAPPQPQQTCSASASSRSACGLG